MADGVHAVPELSVPWVQQRSPLKFKPIWPSRYCVAVEIGVAIKTHLSEPKGVVFLHSHLYQSILKLLYKEEFLVPDRLL